VFERLFSSSATRSAAEPERRGASRVPVALTGLLSAGGCDDEVSVVNLSGGGAMLETALALRVGDRSILSIEGWGSVPVVVRWVDGHRAGVAFDR
jgi:chemotaxis receptor (MCP) glutamine deamidase CheD